MWLWSAVSKSPCGLDDGYIDIVGFKLPFFIICILIAEEFIRPLVSISLEMVWDYISTG